MLGAYFAWKLNVPLAASWHTNLHEYAGRRMNWLTQYLSEKQGIATERSIEAGALRATSSFYRLAKVLFAPNDELCKLLEKVTGRSCHLMQRGVDIDLFSPSRRTRAENDGNFLLGYVGRLSIEKNVALLIRVERELAAMGIDGVRFVIVGHGNEEASLRAALTRADFAGVLRGAELAQAYADMDVLVFPSHTDTFGNVVLEALASCVPAIVTCDGGPKFIVREGDRIYRRRRRLCIRHCTTGAGSIAATNHAPQCPNLRLGMQLGRRLRESICRLSDGVVVLWLHRAECSRIRTAKLILEASRHSGRSMRK